MSRDTINLTDELTAYIRRVGIREDADLAALREETGHHRLATMQIAQEQGAFMALLVRLLGARKTLEVGVFTGYSSMAVAKAMGPEGRVLALDVSEEFTAVARRHWAKAGVADRIELRLRPAAESLKELVAAGETETFDFAFIDADKTGYAQYYEEVLTRLRPGGLILMDNTLQGGHVVGDLAGDQDVAAIRSVNDAIAADPRVKVVLIPIGDGVSLVQKLR